MRKICWRQNEILNVISDQKFMIRKINEKLLKSVHLNNSEIEKEHFEFHAINFGKNNRMEERHDIKQRETKLAPRQEKEEEREKVVKLRLYRKKKRSKRRRKRINSLNRLLLPFSLCLVRISHKQ